MELENCHEHPNPMPNPHHRLIELQSTLDLTYLQTKLSAAAQQKIDLHFPPTAYRPPPPPAAPAKPAECISLDGHNPASQSISPHQPTAPSQSDLSSEDPLRARVWQLVDAFLTRTWAGAAHSISINGLAATSLPSISTTSTGQTANEQSTEEREGVDFNYAPYDGKLQARVASLYGELETLTAQVSKLRREAPKKSAEAYERQLRAQMERDEREWMEEKDEVPEGAKERGIEMGLEIQPMRNEWYEDVQSMYERGVGELSRLAGLADDGQSRKGGSLTETVGKVQRARTVAMEFE